jgi:crossover junction endodeoxyribonuclease RuvC
MKVITIDPGKVASYAILDSKSLHEISVGEFDLIGKGRLVRPCPLHMRSVIEENGIDFGLVEEVGAMKGQGVTSMFSFGLMTGSILNALGAMAIGVDTVTPPKWKSTTGIKTDDKAEAKREARHLAKQLWPHLYEQLKPVGSHGMAEAALMARWFFIYGPGKDAPEVNLKKALEVTSGQS